MMRRTDHLPLSGKETWLALEDYERQYHLEQFDAPLGYATALIDFLERHTPLGSGEPFRVLDVGTGAGANLLWMSRAFPRCSFVGIDINEELLEAGRRHLREHAEIELLHGDAIRADEVGEFDLVTSFQVLSWLDFDDALRSIRAQIGAARHGVAATALLTERDADYLIEVRDHHAGKRKAVTIFCHETLDGLAADHGWQLLRSEPFTLDVDLPDPGLPRELFTKRMADGRNLVFAGDVFLPHSCVLFEPRRGRG